MISNILKDHLTVDQFNRAAKLPVWALHFMEKLAVTANTYKRDLDEVRAAFAAVGDGGDEQTTTWVQLLDGESIAAGTNPDVRHRLADGDEITATFHGTGVNIVCSDSAVTLAVHPVVANEVLIMPNRRGRS